MIGVQGHVEVGVDDAGRAWWVIGTLSQSRTFRNIRLCAVLLEHVDIDS